MNPRGENMSKDNTIGVPKPGEQPTRDQLKELLLHVLDGIVEEKEQNEVSTPKRKANEKR